MLEEPDRLVVFVWSEEELTRLFTPERLRLLRRVCKRPYESLSELAREVGRDVSAVRKDVRRLAGYGLLRLEREGNRVRVLTDAERLYIPLREPQSQAEATPELAPA